MSSSEKTKLLSSSKKTKRKNAGNLRVSLDTLLLVFVGLAVLHLEYAVQQIKITIHEDRVSEIPLASNAARASNAQFSVFAENFAENPKFGGTTTLATTKTPQTTTNNIQKNSNSKTLNKQPWKMSPKIGANLVIIGAAKCGTAALVHFMAQHSQVTNSMKWEAHFWDQGWKGSKTEDKNFLTYSDHFDIKSYLDPKIRVWVEKTPNYICSSTAFENIGNFAPDMKFILLVCDPVGRAWSHYQQVLRSGCHRNSHLCKPMMKLQDQDKEEGEGTFKDLVVNSIKLIDELGVLKDGVLTPDEIQQFLMTYTSHGKHAGLFTILQGLYSVYLKIWIKKFDINSFMFVDGDKMVSDPGSVMEEIQVKLGLGNELSKEDFYFNEDSGMFCVKTKYSHVLKGTETTDCVGGMLDGKSDSEKSGDITRDKGRTRSTVSSYAMDEDVRVILAEFYKKYNEEFFEMIGREFYW